MKQYTWKMPVKMLYLFKRQGIYLNNEKIIVDWVIFTCQSAKHWRQFVQCALCTYVDETFTSLNVTEELMKYNLT